MNVENPSEQMGMQLQETTKVHNIQVDSRTSSKWKSPSETGKSFKTQAYPFANNLDENSLTGFKKKKYLKASIKAPTQSYLCLAIEQRKT